MCIVSTRTYTAAAVARDALRGEGIYAEVVSVDPSLTEYGCSWGVSFNCSQTERVLSVLKRRNISFGGIIGGRR